MNYYGIDPKSNNKIKEILNKNKNMTRAIYPITIMVFNDTNKNGIKESSEPGLSGVYVTLKDNNGNCTSTITNINGITAFYPNQIVAGYKVYYTNKNISGNYDDSYFDSLYITPPLENYLPTTRMTTSISSPPTSTISYGFAYYRPFDCKPVGYVIYSPGDDGSTGTFRPSNLAELNLNTGKPTTIGNFATGSNPNLRLNSLSYNTTDNLLYAYTRYDNNPPSTISGLYRIETTTSIGMASTTISKVSISFVNTQNNAIMSPLQDFGVGSSDYNGNYYIYRANSSTNKTIYKLNINPNSLNFGTFVTLVMDNVYSTLYDFAYNSHDNSLYGYGGNVNKYLIKINLTTLTAANTISTSTLPVDYSQVTTQTTADSGQDMLATFIDINNDLYTMSASGDIYKLDTSTDSSGKIVYGKFIYLSKGYQTSNADGASCKYTNLGADYGNAPDDGSYYGTANYKSKLANNGPRHGILDTLKLGEVVLTEPNATLDPQDNDCLVVNPLIPLNISLSSYNLDINVTNNSGTTSYIYGWLDFNKDGVFGIDEYITSITGPNVSTSIINVGATVNTLCKIESIGSGLQTVNLTFSKPSTVTLTQGNTFLRLRLTTDILTTTVTSTIVDDTRSLGAASNGEVEDYLLSIEPCPIINAKKFAKNITNTLVHVGDTITYGISISNSGSKEAYNVTVKDTDIVSMVNASIVSIDLSSFKVYTGVDTSTFVNILVPNLANGVNIGTIPANTFKTLTFDGKVLGCNNC